MTPPTILIVDDDESVRETIEGLLMTEGYNLAFAADGHEALAAAAQLDPDLVVLDVMMPGLSGLDVCRTIRTRPDLAEMPIIMVTAYDDRQTRLSCIEAGADDFLTKPFDRVELRARIRTITRLNRYRRLQSERRELQRQLQRLAALRTIDQAIASSFDLHLSLGILLDQALVHLGVSAADVLLFARADRTLEFLIGRGFRSGDLKGQRLRLGEGYAGRAALVRGPVSVPDLQQAHDPARAAALSSEEFVFYHALPLITGGQIKGVLELFHRERLEPSSDWHQFLGLIADQAALAMDRADLIASLRRSRDELAMAYDETLEAWVSALDMRNHEPEGHTWRVTELTLEIARRCGLSDEELIHMRRGALLHDIGKMAVSDDILLKPDRLTVEEWEIMRRHPIDAYEWLKDIPFLRPSLDIPYCHHEKWDGTGYPRGLRGDEIPLAARIFAIVDVWDALTHERPYHAAWPRERARQFILEQSDRHFDPALAAMFLSMVDLLPAGSL